MLKRLLPACCFLVCLACSGPSGTGADGGSVADVGMKPGFVPGGTFQMGSATGLDDEKPVTPVTLTPYLLDLTEVTTSEYGACVSAGRCTLPEFTNGWCNYGVAGKESDPINCVGWKQAKSYCEWTDARLPTEAEWEFAARGTDGRKYPWGNEEPPLPSADSMLVEWGPGLDFTTAPVGTHPLGAGPFGHQDLAGNVWEWVEDEYRPYGGAAITNPLSEDTHEGWNHVARGGSWLGSASELTTTARRQYPFSFPDTIVGFRCARGVASRDSSQPPPVSFFMVKERGTDSVTFSWDPVDGLEGITLYSGDSPTSATPVEHEVPANASSFKLVTPYNGTAAYYWLRLKGKAGLGPPSRVLKASPAPPQVTGLTVTSDLGSISVRWDGLTVPVGGYELYRDGQEWTPTGSSMTALEFRELDPERTYSFEVAALGPDLVPGPRTAAVSASLGKATQLSAGNGHFCALDEAKTVWCWGANVTGGIGNGTIDPAPKGSRVVGPDGTGALTDVKAIAPGGAFTCALKTDGTAWCWGLNDKGQLGDGTTNNSTKPVQVVTVPGPPLTGVDLLAAGSTHACAVKTGGGAVFCWGSNAHSALGSNSFSGPYRAAAIAVSGLSGVGTLSGATSISVGAQSSCVTKANNSVWCWGYNGNGQLGDNQPDTNGSGAVQDKAYAVQVVGAGGTGTLSATEVSVGLYQACAVGTDGVVYCWGRDVPGDYSINNSMSIYQGHHWGIHYPIATPGLNGAATLSGVAGLGGLWHHYCGVSTDHHALCWEENPSNVLLDDSGMNHPWPSESTIGGISAIAAGVEASCALFDGLVKCWGKNANGQLGDGSTTDRTTPSQVLYAY